MTLDQFAMIAVPCATFVLGVLVGRPSDWKTVRDTGVHLYQQNQRTGARRVLRGGDNEPVDTHWVATGEWWKPSAPPNYRRPPAHDA